MEGLAQVNLIVTDLEAGPGGLGLARVAFDPEAPEHGGTDVPRRHESRSSRAGVHAALEPAFAGPTAGSTVVDLNLSSREAVDDTYPRISAAGHTSSVEPWDTFFGARYAIVCDPDGHRIGLKSAQDPTRSYPLET